MSEKLFESDNRDQAHRVLEYVLGQRKASDNDKTNGVDPQWPGAEKFAKYAGKHPRASCREDAPAGKVSVWNETTWERDENYESEQAVARKAMKQSAQEQAAIDQRIEALTNAVGVLAASVIEIKNAVVKKKQPRARRQN